MRDDTSLREVEPELGAIEAYETRDEPPFPLVIRGYDRRSVDDCLEAMSARLIELEALQTPSLAVRQALERVADDTGSILKEAHETADEVTRRAREDSERMVREATEEADRIVSSAQARARQIAIDTDALWQERMRLIDDAHVTATALAELADSAAARFPAEPEEESVVAVEPVEEVEQPTEAFDVGAVFAAQDAAEAELLAGEEEESLPDGLDDLEPPPEFR